MLGEVKKFHKKLQEMTKDYEISSRLQDVVESALRSSYYDLVYETNKREALKNHLISAMIDKRAFEKAKNKKECIELSEKIADEILKVGGKDLKRFCELYVKWNSTQELLEEIENRKFSDFPAKNIEKFQKKR